ncbi:DNA-deoxyinosine glycosylase [Tenacibaculum sp. TC6]|uniref:DNA-deoxyinosine glycosylase n=1 Tax=Tenacibaculum sp. TC6 TaxID=3423223 RepID=UPI003D36665E
MNESYINSFSPIVGDEPKVLLLGTMPGKESLRLQEYYGNTRNAFWKIVFSHLNVVPVKDYEEKKKLIQLGKIAIWDVCYTAIRKTSLDADIKNEKPNEIEAFLKLHPSITTIGFNGKKAEKLYDKFFKRHDAIDYFTLLSTSPANARYTFEDKLNNWKTIFERL